MILRAITAYSLDVIKIGCHLEIILRKGFLTVSEKLCISTETQRCEYEIRLALAGCDIDRAEPHRRIPRGIILKTFALATLNDMHVTSIPDDFPFKGILEFKPERMRELFSFGERCAIASLTSASKCPAPD
jgi:hypothetical protein